MDNLFWLQKDKKSFNLLEKPFTSEEEFEKKIFDTKEILEDVYRIDRQVIGGSKPGIPDIIGVDNDGKVCIIEMKNEKTDSSIIPQVLEYALWAENNPDSIKSLLLELHDVPEEIQVNWEDYQIRIIIIAPKIDPSTVQAVNKIDYDVDLIEIKRWIQDSNEFLLVNKMEPAEQKKIRPIHGIGNYNREFYEKQYNTKSAKLFLETADRIKQLTTEKDWPLERKFNRNYCGFKYGSFNVFGVKWLGSKSFAVFFKLPQSLAEKTQSPNWKMEKYQERWKEAIYKVEDLKEFKDLEPLFQKAMQYKTEKE